MNPLNSLLANIVERCHPQQVWLFGSRARGDARSDSDWDLLVVVDDDSPESFFDPRFAWRLKERSGVRAEIILCKASDFHSAQDVVNTLSYDAAHEGVLVLGR